MVGFGIGKTHGAYVGGHVNNVINLSKALSKEGHEIEIVSTPPIFSNNNPETIQITENVTINTVNTQKNLDSTKISVKGRLSILQGLKSYFKIVNRIKKLNETKKFDVVHGHSGLPWVAAIPEYLRFKEKIPTTHTLYCPIEKVLKIPSKFCLSNLDTVVSISENVGNSLDGVVNIEKVLKIPPMIDLERFVPKIKKTQNKFRILYLGNLSRSKGLDNLINALNIIKKTEYIDFELFLGLDMPVKEYYDREITIKRKIKKLDLESNVVPLGIIEDLPNIMAKSDVFVAPFQNTQEPADYPLSILEAMSSGLPTISTNVGGIPEIVKNNDTGILIDPESSNQLAEAIIYLFENKIIRQKIGQKGSLFVHELNSNILESTLNNYREIVI